MNIRLQRGFTLIELMIVVVVVAILAAVAYPSYQDSVRKGRRADAQGYLQDLALRQEQYLVDSRKYGSLADLKMATPPSNIGTYYTITLPVRSDGPPPTFTLQAEPTGVGSQNKDKCGTMTIDNTGAKTPTGCW